MTSSFADCTAQKKPKSTRLVSGELTGCVSNSTLAPFSSIPQETLGHCSQYAP